MSNWHDVCLKEDLVPNVGVCALVEQQQIAIFICDRTDSLFAVSNYDPIGKANVMSRGIIGSVEGEPYVASPLYKQHFHLKTGACLEEPSQTIPTYAIRENDGVIQIGVTL